MISPYLIDLQNALETTHEDLPTVENMQKWVDAVLILFEPAAELTIRLVEKDEIQQLNKTYRNKNKPTNVLSFPTDYHESLEVPLIGDLVICVDVVREEAIEQRKPFEHHFAHMIIHGCLHLLGYDHLTEEDAEEMESLEIEVLSDLGISNPYLID